MTDTVVATLVWIALALHIVVLIVTLRSAGSRPLVPLLNLAVALSVLGYWVSRWYSYVFQGVTWSASDQIIPLYALLVCALSLLSLSGRYQALNWIAFGIHSVVILGAVLFVTFFRMDRLF